MYVDDSWHFQSHWHASHCCCNVHAANTDAEHSDGTAMWCVAVTTHADLSRCSETCYVDSVADTVSRSGYMNSETFGCRLKIDVVVRCFEVYIEKIVV